MSLLIELFGLRLSNRNQASSARFVFSLDLFLRLSRVSVYAKLYLRHWNIENEYMKWIHEVVGDTIYVNEHYKMFLEQNAF